MFVSTIGAALLAFLLAGCTSNPPGGAMRDGRVLVTVDVPVGWGSGSLLRITTWVEGYDEPFITQLFDYRQEVPARRGGVDFEGSLSWEDNQSTPIDVTGLMLEGGTEVRVKATDYALYYVTREISFTIDGNVGLRVYSVPPENQTYEIVRLY